MVYSSLDPGTLLRDSEEMKRGQTHRHTYNEARLCYHLKREPHCVVLVGALCREQSPAANIW